MRCIDADALKKDLNVEFFYESRDRYRIRDLIDVQPTISPKTGRWIMKEGIYGVAYCSECDFELHINNTHYCPNCGARMEEVTECG